MRILIAAGGTGGHVYPALAVAEAVAEHYPQMSCAFVGSVNGFERPLIEQSGIVFESYDEVAAGPLHGVSAGRFVGSLFQHLRGIVQAWRLLTQRQPAVILLTGGWVGLPVSVAAYLRGIPILIFLPDIEPGLAIKVLRHLARRVAISVPDSARYFAPGQAVVTGYPVRRALEQATRADGIAHFGLDPDRRTLLVFGGSRGAQTINTALLDILPRLLADGFQVVHVTGTLDWERVQTALAALTDSAEHYHPKPYLHQDMGLALAAADLVVSRSGAGVLGEFPQFGVPSVLVPYPYAWRYQKVNADYLSSRGAAITMADEAMQGTLYETVASLLKDAPRLAHMRENVQALAQLHGAQRVAQQLWQLAGGSGQ